MKTMRILSIDKFANSCSIDSVKLLKRDQVIALLRQRQGDLTGADFSKRLGIHPSLLSEVYKGTREPGEAILEYLGLNKRVLYEKSA
jgi:hypothetical protein